MNLKRTLIVVTSVWSLLLSGCTSTPIDYKCERYRVIGGDERYQLVLRMRNDANDTIYWYDPHKSYETLIACEADGSHIVETGSY